jgi:hypothetical protein
VPCNASQADCKSPVLWSEVCSGLVRGGEGCEVEPRLEYVVVAICAENSKRDQRIVMVRISKSSRVSRSARPEDFYLLANVHFREMLVRFSTKDVRACPLLHTDPFMAWSATLIGRLEQSSPKAAQRSVVDAGLYGEDASRSTMDLS